MDSASFFNAMLDQKRQAIFGNNRGDGMHYDSTQVIFHNGSGETLTLDTSDVKDGSFISGFEVPSSIAKDAFVGWMVRNGSGSMNWATGNCSFTLAGGSVVLSWQTRDPVGRITPVYTCRVTDERFKIMHIHRDAAQPTESDLLFFDLERQ